MEMLPTFNDCKTKKELKEAAIKWIKHLESQEGIPTYDHDRFDFTNQLDDFQNDDDEYTEVIAFIKWFFEIGHIKGR